MGILKKTNLLTLFIFLRASFSCREVSVPKPKGHFRIDLPQKKYLLFDETPGTKGYMPISFEYPEYGNLTFTDGKGTGQGWFNIEFPRYKAKIYLTYKDVINDFEGLMEQTYKMNVKNHIAKADAINEQVFNNMEEKVYGILYDLNGNTDVNSSRLEVTYDLPKNIQAKLNYGQIETSSSENKSKNNQVGIGLVYTFEK